MTLKTINIKAIRIDGGTQPRESINMETVGDYAEGVKAGIEFPPVVVFHDGAEYWLADGFHRYHAHTKTDRTSISADVRQGTLDDAKLFASGANGDHGLRRTNADKRLAVLMALSVKADWSDNHIASHVGVSHTFVGSVRFSLATVASENSQERTYTTKSGATATMKTGGIGKKKKTSTAKADSKKSAPQVETDSSAPADDGPDADELEAQAKAEAADAVWLQKLLDSDDKLAAAHAEIKRLNAVIATLEVVRDGYMNGRNEAIKMVKRLQTRLDKLERAAA